MILADADWERWLTMNETRVGDKLLLVSHTSKGRNRLWEHGQVWIVEEIRSEVTFSNEPGPWLKVRSEKTGYIRWMKDMNDIHFEIATGSRS